MLLRLLNEAFSMHKILALCSHVFFVSVCLMHLMLGALVDRRGAPGGCSNGCTWQYVEVKWKSCVKVRGSRAPLLPPPQLICLFPCCPNMAWTAALPMVLLEPYKCLCLLVVWEGCQRLP